MKTKVHNIRWKIAIFGMVSAMLSFGAAAQTIRPVTWNVIGLDSNKPATTQPAPGVYPPDRFPVGVEICNTTSSTITGYTTKFVWDESPSTNYIHLWDSAVNWNDGSGNTGNDTEATVTQEVPDLAASECVDMYYWVQIEQVAAAYDFTRDFHVELLNADTTPAVVAETPNNSTPVSGTTTEDRELYVEYLVSQNRNAVISYQINDGTPIDADGTGSVKLARGQIFDLTLYGQTATQGYEQIEAFIVLPPDLFEVTEVSATYSSAAGTDPYALDQLYADGCGWINNPATAGYHESSSTCTSVGKYGGKITKKYKVRVRETLYDDGSTSTKGKTAAFQALIYDFSGSSYHYNADHASSSLSVTIDDPGVGGAPTLPTLDASITKTAVDNGNSGTGTWTITVTRETDLCNGGSSCSAFGPIKVTDELPAGYSLKGQGQAPSASVGTLTFYNAGGSPISYSDAVRFIEWDVTLPVGTDSANLQLEFKPSGNAIQSDADVSNCAVIQADKDATNNEACVTIFLSTPVTYDVAVRKAVERIDFDANGAATATFLITVNTVSGTNDAIQVKDVLPAGYTFVGTSSPTGGLSFSSESSGTVILDYAQGSTSGSIKISATVALPSASDSIDTIEANYINEVVLTDSSGAALNDANTGNNRATAAYVPPLLRVTKSPSLKTFSQTAPTGGFVLNYDLSVTKLAGFSSGDTVKLIESPPPGLEFSAITEEGGTTTWSCTVDGSAPSFPVTGTVVCVRTVQAGEASPLTYPKLTFSSKLNPTPTTDKSYVNSVSVEGFDSNGALANTFDDDDAVIQYSSTALATVTISGKVFEDTTAAGTGYDGIFTSNVDTVTQAGGGLYACINTSPAQFSQVDASGAFSFSSVTQGANYTVLLTTTSSGASCPTTYSLNANWYPTGETADGSTTDSAVVSGKTVSDGKLDITVGSSSVTTLTFGVVQGGVFDPPFGTKTGEFLAGQPVIRWTMVWINDSPITVTDALITDAPPTGTTYATSLTSGTDTAGITCTPAGSTTVDFCRFDIDAGQLEVQADFGPETGNPQTAAAADNELVIVFDVTYDAANPEAQYENQASLSWTPPSGGSPLTRTTDDPAKTGATDPTVIIPTLPSSPKATPVPLWTPFWLLATCLMLLGVGIGRGAGVGRPYK